MSDLTEILQDIKGTNTTLLYLSFQLRDVWCTLNPHSQTFTWFKLDGLVKSRLDFWLLSDTGSNLETNSTISTAPLTDHSLIKLILTPTNARQRKKGYWNSSLLKCEPFCQEIISVIININEDCNLTNYREKWEFLKYRARQISISHSKKINQI